MLPNFDINSKHYISKKFVAKGITNFHDAIIYIKTLPYGKNLQNKLFEVLDDEKGNNASKNAILVQLAHENGFDNISLALGFFEVDANSTTVLKETFANKKIDKFPEAVNYILYNNARYDLSGLNLMIKIPFDKIENEIVILPNQISDFVNHFHRFFMINWIKENKLNNTINVDDLWNFRKQCENQILKSFAKTNISKKNILQNSLKKVFAN